MATENEIVISLKGDVSDLSRKLDSIKSRLDKFSSDTEKQTKRVSDAFGVMLSAISFSAISSGVKSLVKDLADFEKEFKGVVTLLDNTSFRTKTLEQGIADLESGIIDLRASTGKSFSDLNKGLFDLVSAGVDAEEAIKTLNIANKLAVAGVTDVSVAVDGLTSALNAYGLSADKAEEVAALFFQAQKFGKTTVEELSNNFGKAASIASNFGVSMEELLASVSALTMGGTSTSEAFTAMRAILVSVTTATKEAQEEASRLGIEFTSTAVRTKGLKGFLDDLVNAQGFNKTSAEKLFGSVEALNGVYALTGSQAESFTKTLTALNDKQNAATTFTNAYIQSSDTLSQMIDKLGGAVDRLGIQFTKTFDTHIRNFFVGTTYSVYKLTDTLAEIKEDPVTGLGKAFKEITDYINPAGRLINNLTYSIDKFDKGPVEGLKTAFQAVVGSIEGAVGAAAGIDDFSFENIKELGSITIPSLVTGTSDFIGKLQEGIPVAQALQESLKAALTPVAAAIAPIEDVPFVPTPGEKPSGEEFVKKREEAQKELGIPTAAELEEAFAELTKTEEELEIFRYQQKIERLKEFLENELILTEEQRSLIEGLIEESENKITQLKKDAAMAQLETSISLAKGLFEAFSGQSKKAFEALKAVKIAEALITGYQATVDAYQKGVAIGGPAVGAVYAAIAAATVAGQIQQIKSTSYGSKGGGGGSAAGGASSATGAIGSAGGEASGGDSTSKKQIDITLQGDTFTSGSVRSLIEKINEEQDNGSILKVYPSGAA